ncbi:mevalonate kinase family protein [Rufibacter tibetensis]|uniref:GHMP kinase n=1 Tax=Rufibacter tibetensis TaxID=512763 RepID=A0A0P0CDC7_9BACT|nr:GHMP kinase [Rufibacter tibetensis]ALJ01698.1 GHMP kinase [Rufibacter tibetensis]
MILESRAYARAALLGNPSDGYHGKTISLNVKNFGAHILLYQTPELSLEPQEQDSNQFKNIYQLQEQLNLTGYHGGIPLLKASIKKFLEYCQAHGITLANKNFTIRYGSNIPRQIGLAGSSAIVIATLRALMQFYEVSIPLETLPNIALSAELDELGINAGLQDRVIQTYEGCVYMDFDKQMLLEKKHGYYEPLELSLLPPLYIAYKTELGKVSGKVLNDIRTRYEKGDVQVISTLDKIAGLADAGKKAILDQDYDALHQLMDQNADFRKDIMHVSDSNLELLEVARRCGASANFTGSGGSVIGMYHGDDMLNMLVKEMRKINARVIKPVLL